LYIIDHDGPTFNILLGKPKTVFTKSFSHTRNNFTQRVVFHFEAEFAERCSTQFKWAFTGDGALGTDEKLCFIRGKPNEGKSYNSVLVGEHLPTLDVEFKVPTLKDANTGATRKIKRETDEVVFLFGAENSELIGLVYLRKDGANKIYADKVAVSSQNQFSDTNIVVAHFNTKTQASAGWEVVIVNSAGESKIAGFEIVD